MDKTSSSSCGTNVARTTLGTMMIWMKMSSHRHWMLNRLRPDMKVGDLRCGDYDQIAEKFKLATERVRESSPADFDYMVDKIVHYLQKSQFDKILDMALELGFDPEWLSRKKRPKKVKAMDRMAMSKSYKKQEEAAADQGAGSSVVLTG